MHRENISRNTIENTSSIFVDHCCNVQTLTEIFEKSSVRSSRSHFKKSWRCYRESLSSHRMQWIAIILSYRHRVKCDEFEVVRYNFRMNIKNRNNSTSHFDWMQKNENVRKKSSNFASLSKTLQLRDAIVRIMLVVTCEVSKLRIVYTIWKCQNHARRNMRVINRSELCVRFRMLIDVY